MPFNFLEKEANDRLIAAIIGSVDNKINMKEVARVYGPAVPFNTIEWYLRKVRHQAVAMRAEADGKPVPAASRAKGKAKKAGDVGPTKAGVIAGRITKKKTAPVKVKPEALDEAFLGFGLEDEDNEGASNDCPPFGANEGDEDIEEEV